MSPNRRADIALSPEEQIEFLQGGGTLQVATNGPHGYPHLSAMGFWLIDGRIHFSTYRKSQKVVNLARDPRISCMLEQGRAYETLQGLVIQGIAHIVDDAESIRELHRHRSLDEGANPFDSLTPEQRRTTESKRTVVWVEPERVYSWDHRKLRGRY